MQPRVTGKIRETPRGGDRAPGPRDDHDERTPFVTLTADIGDSLQNFTDELFSWLPRLLGAIIILVIAYLVAKAVRSLIERLLPRTGIDQAVHSGTAGQYVARYAEGLRPTSIIAGVAFWFIFLMGILLAASALGIEALSETIASIVAYLPNVIAAIIILAVALAIAGAIGGAVAKLMGDTALGKIAATVVPALVLTIAVFMALVQLRIAVEIVTGAFYIVLGAIALGAALAFGLGGRDAAKRLLDGAYERGREAAPQVRAEAALAKDRVMERKDQAEQAARDKRAEVEDDGPQRDYPGGERPARDYPDEPSGSTRRLEPR